MSIAINYETGGNSDTPIGDLGTDEYNEAMSFTTVDAIVVPFVDLYIRKVNSITDPISFRLETNAAGPTPSGTLVAANATASASPSNTSYDWVRFTLAANISLAAATKYWIKVTVPAGQATNDHYDWQRNSPSGTYADGGEATQVNLGAWGNEGAGDDCYFRVYKVDPVTGNTGYAFVI